MKNRIAFVVMLILGFLVGWFGTAQLAKAETYTYESETECYYAKMYWDREEVMEAGYRGFQMRYVHEETGETHYYRQSDTEMYSVMIVGAPIDFCGFGHWDLDVRFGKYDPELGPADWTEWYNVKKIHIYVNDKVPNAPIIIEEVTA